MTIISNNAPTLMPAWLRYYSDLAYQSLLMEVNLTPKPGLVDQADNGAHHDMCLQDFYRSAAAIRPWLARFLQAGVESVNLSASNALAQLRPMGLACEQAMLQATNGVNTHKGGIFSFGLICAAIGRCLAQQLANKKSDDGAITAAWHGGAKLITPQRISQQVAILCRGLVNQELKDLTVADNALTAGQRIYRQFAITGARGQAESGYALVIERILPFYWQQYQQLGSSEFALLNCLLLLMANNDDTNVIARGGIAGLRWLQNYAAELLATIPDFIEQQWVRLKRFNQHCIERHLSPGGSADLLAITWFFSQLSPITLH